MLLGYLNETGKPLGIMNSNIRQDLPIKGYVRLAQSLHETTVRHIVGPGSGIDPRDP
jgi:hypothetical protein